MWQIYHEGILRRILWFIENHKAYQIDEYQRTKINHQIRGNGILHQEKLTYRPKQKQTKVDPRAKRQQFING